MNHQRLIELDLAKGLAIALVVLGHVGSRTQPAGNEWFGQLTALIYEFHMPFFMFLSGAVFQATFRSRTATPDLLRYIGSRASRLLLPFFLFALIIWFGKLLANRFVYVDNVQSEGLLELAKIFLRPSESVATSLWYVYVLFQLTAFSAAFLVMTRGRVAYLFLIASLATAAFHLVPITSLLAANLTCEFAVFFALGIVFAMRYQSLSDLATSYSLPFYVLFAFSFTAILFVPHPASKLIIGLCSLPALFAFASSFRSKPDRSALLLLSEYTLSIYLMNTLLIGLSKGILMKVVPWDGLNFLFYLPLLLVAGLLGPIAVHRLVLVRWPVASKLTK